MHISNIVLNLNNKIASVILTNDNTIFTIPTQKYSVRENILYINSSINQSYSILINAITVTNDSEVQTNLIHTQFNSRAVNSPCNAQEVFLKAIYVDTMIRIYECIVPVKYIFNESVELLISSNFSSPVIYASLSLEN